MSERPARTGRALLGLVIALAGLGIPACTGSHPEGHVPDGASRSAPAAKTTSLAEMPAYIEKADKANERAANTVVAAAAQPSAVKQGSAVTPMVIRDEGDDAWKAGDYRLVVYCAGTGVLYVHFRLGTATRVKEFPPCTPEIMTGAVELRLAEDATGSAVIIIPVGDTRAAVSYQIQRL